MTSGNEPAPPKSNHWPVLNTNLIWSEWRTAGKLWVSLLWVGTERIRIHFRLLQLDIKSSGQLWDPSEKTPPLASSQFSLRVLGCVPLQKTEPWIYWVGRKKCRRSVIHGKLSSGKGCSGQKNKHNFYIKRFCTFLMQCGFTGKLCSFYNSFCTLGCLSYAYCNAYFYLKHFHRPFFRHKGNYSKLGNSQNSRFKLISGLNMGTGLYTSFYIKYSLKEVE